MEVCARTCITGCAVLECWCLITFVVIDETKEFLYSAIEKYEHVALSCSFGAAEGMVIIDLLNSLDIRIPIFVLDTGRLPQETHNLIDRIRDRYDVNIDMVFPNSDELFDLVKTRGPNCFFDSVSNRKLCCHVRKVAPLKRYMENKGYKAYISGVRKEHSEERSKAERIEKQADGMIKINPLCDWTYTDVWEYVNANSVPVNKLHTMGYESVGCAPCSRPGKGRDGRWWWENSNKECGIHDYGHTDGSGI